MAKKTTKTKKSTKTKIKIQGKNFMVAKEVEDSIKFLSEIIRAHEVALLTWTHKTYGENKLEDKELESFNLSLKEYCMQIPEAENILVRMKEMDEQMLKDVKKENQNKDTEKQGVEE